MNAEKWTESSEEQSGGLPNIHQGLSSYDIPDHTVLAERKTDQGKGSVFHGLVLNMEIWSRTDQAF